MKISKSILFCLLSSVGFMQISCGDSKKSASESTILNDSTAAKQTVQGVMPEKFNYALGLMIGDNLAKNLGVTSKTINADDFCNAIADALKSSNIKELSKATTDFRTEAQKISIDKQQNKPLAKFSAAFSKNAGSNFGVSFKTAGLSAETFKTEEFKKGFLGALGEGTPEMDMQASDQILRQGFEFLKNIILKKNSEEGKKFLAENLKNNPKLKTTATGIQYEILKEGKGDKPKVTDKVLTHYHGTHIDGSVFDSSVDRGEPIEFPLNGVIKGWTEILQLMPKGSKWKVYIPSDLAYGPQGSQGGIGPNETLIFEIELFKINGK
jgi:FKBP-type peptidyl-prolyl cis-trans isomerase FklB